jgi:hypothetical protein
MNRMAETEESRRHGMLKLYAKIILVVIILELISGDLAVHEILTTFSNLGTPQSTPYQIAFNYGFGLAMTLMVLVFLIYIGNEVFNALINMHDKQLGLSNSTDTLSKILASTSVEKVKGNIKVSNKVKKKG